MSNTDIQLHHPRVIKARFGRVLDSKPLRLLLWAIVAVSLLGWLYAVWVLHIMVAHLLLALSGTVAVALFWYYGELDELPVSQSVNSSSDINMVLSRHLLARLRPGMSPQALVKLVAGQEGGRFYAARFGVGPDFLSNLTSPDATQAAAVWQKALQVAEVTKSQSVDSSVLTAALILSLPQPDQLLAHYELDSQDILAGVGWRQHIQQVIERHRERRHYGGIGRDLSFGWAPLLNNVAYNLTESIQAGGLLLRPVGSRQQAVDQIIHLLSQPGRRNATLVGEAGVGKTSLVQGVAQKLVREAKNLPTNLQYQQVMELNASHLIANAKGRGQLEELLIRVFNEAIRAKNVILFLDEAQLFLQEGTGSVNLSNILLPVLEGGALKIILALNDQEWLRLSQTNSGLAQLLNRVVVSPLNEAETVQVIQDQTLNLEAKHQVVLMYQAISESYKLADRFIHEQAFPGKALKLLEAAAGFPEQQHFLTARSVQQAAEKSFDVKVQTASTADEKNTLLELEDRIHKRMINQTRAVKLVSDALRRARTGVRNQNKPIGTFLFLGPTGVGKTELTKALADVYFGGEDRLVRVDLNEYSHPDDTNRILAVGATDPYGLCAQIAKQPFSVVLLDEIEKAHPNVLNLLLQMLDEGQLRDAQNKPISFKDAIIIATSNAGADKIRQHIEKGEQLEQFEQQFVDELINSGDFRPEFLNRFDEIILFRPLTKEELMQVVDLLVVGLNKTLAARKISVALTPAAKELVVDKGYDPRLGARPLRRAVQRSVENVVAQRLLGQGIEPGQTLTLDAPDLANSFEG